jgi:primase-polymerase (primpol)-like protein
MNTIQEHSTDMQVPELQKMLNLSQHPEKEMQLLQQWVCWRYEIIGGQRKKPPYSPRTGRKTDIIRDKPWGTYSEAIAAYKNGNYDGIGFVFLPSDPYTGIDLDHCIKLETGKIAEWARKILNAIPSYAEYSPSGDGLHIISKATLPDRGLKEGNIEVYSNGVYFTWTNNHLIDSPDTIEEQQEHVVLLHDWLLIKRSLKEIKEYTWGGEKNTLGSGSPPAISWLREDEELTDTELQARDQARNQADTWILNKARSAKNGAAFAQLYDTIIPDAEGGQSIGDIQLCVQLLYWCRDTTDKPDVDWADRLFRKSARMRSKWDRRLGKYTYGQVTLYKAYMHVERRYGQFWQKKGGK